MVRWLVRLFVLALIAIVGVIVVSRLTNRDEDFEDYDDLEGGFDFQETPVEIEVPAQQSAGSMGADGASMSAATESTGNLTDIVGIGPAFDARLKALGFNNLADLAQADANSLSEQLDVIGGLATIEDWITQAKSLSSQGASNGRSQ
jgi:predicted flap endonuclease-1-like 5' DNA nuclease